MCTPQPQALPIFRADRDDEVFPSPPPRQTMDFGEEGERFDLSWELGQLPENPVRKELKRTRATREEGSTSEGPSTSTPRNWFERNNKVAKKSLNTLRPPSLDLGIATWNINHFNNAQKKIEALCWLFEEHPWLDVLVLQEINLSGKAELDELAGEFARRNLAIVYGPLMQSMSPGEAIAKPRPKASENVKFGDEELEYREDRNAKSFQLKLEGEWVWMRPGQPEYYPLIYRTTTVAHHDDSSPWATYDGAKLTGDKHFWTKATYRKVLFVEPMQDEWVDLLEESGQKRALHPDLLGAFSAYANDLDGEVTFGRKSSSRVGASWTKWPFTNAGTDYELVHLGDEVTAYKHVPIVKAGCRPIVVYDLDVRGKDVHVGVVHTTPAGQGLNRRGEYEQVSRIFEHASNEAAASQATWIIAGDYYLDPQATVQRETVDEEAESEEESGRLLQLFQSALDRFGLRAVIPISATNQSSVDRNYDPSNYIVSTSTPQNDNEAEKKYLRSKTIRLVRDEGNRGDYEVLVVNKRADFFVCTQDLDLHDCGILCPRGGLLKVDPGHNALNFWSEISDHAPVGVLFSSSRRQARRLAVQYEPPDSAERWSQAFDQLSALYAECATYLSSCLSALARSVVVEAYQNNQQYGALAARLCLFIDATLMDSMLQRFRPYREPFEREKFAALATTVDDLTLNAFLLKAFNTKPEETEDWPLWEQTLIDVAGAAFTHLQTLNYTVDAFDITSEHDRYENVVFEKVTKNEEQKDAL